MNKAKFKMRLKQFSGGGAGALLLILSGCLRVHVDPVEVKPITLNINVNYVDSKLDEFYDFEKKYAQNQPATQPATRAADESQAINARFVQ
jgi:hypothetical protein